jgi:hypothetical protein
VPNRRREAGVTLSELLIVLMILSLVTVVALGLLNGRYEKARLARCFSELRSIQSTVWALSDGVTWPVRTTFWDEAWAGKRPGPYFYFANESDPNRGHGNDWDFCDEENPGRSRSRRDCKDVTFVVLCQHNHQTLTNYVYIEDEGPPTFAGWTRLTNPGYDALIHMEGRGGRGGR